MRNLLCFCLLFFTCYCYATDVYVSTDEFGRTQFSDSEPDTAHRQIHIEIRNDYDWDDPGEFNYTPAKPARRKKSGTVHSYSLDELKSKCHAARGRYNNFRGTDKNIDWDTYRARLAKYKADRDEWCSRLARGK